MNHNIITGDAFEQLVLRVWKGLLFGAEDAAIRQQLTSEGIAEQSITTALEKAHRSPILSAQLKCREERVR